MGKRGKTAKSRLRKCEYCGQPFAVPPSSKRRFCSQTCYIRQRYGPSEGGEDIAPYGWCAICGIPLAKTDRRLCYNCSRAVTPANARSAADGSALDTLKTRRCHDCGAPCTDFRCPACRAKFRARNNVPGDMCDD